MMFLNIRNITECTILFLNIALILSENLTNTKIVTRSEIKKKILLWYPQKCKNCYPYNIFGTSNTIFKRHNCSFTNCFIYRNHQKLPRIRNATAYDAIIFNGRLIGRMYSNQLPKKRSPRQVYIFVQLLSPDRHPMCENYYDGFFNWTMTYRLDSDVPWTYFKIKTLDNKTIGPSHYVQWMKQEQMSAIKSRLKMKLLKKTKMAWYFASSCNTTTGRMIDEKEEYIKQLNNSLWRLTRRYIDTYSECGTSENHTKKLLESKLGRHYFFYIADENTDDEDYVTNKLLTALHHDTLPIVYGGADYLRFLPPGSYINAKTTTPKNLAKLMATLVRNRSKYYDYFKWRNHYYFVDNYDLSGVACKLCAKLNQEKKSQSHQYFRYWWDNEYETKCSIKEHVKLSNKGSSIQNLKQSDDGRTVKTIMLWTQPNCSDYAPFKIFKTGNKIFENQECKYTNCYIIPMNRSISPPPDAIMFNGRIVKHTNEKDLPQERNGNQKYIFVQLESAKRYPVCQDYYDNFFNWTMTYRLDSDITWTYFRVKTINNRTIGPRKGIKWLRSQDMEHIDDKLKPQLEKKTKLVAWFVSYCRPVRSWVVDTLNEELKRLESEPVDIFGDCGNLTCSRNDSEKCNQIIREDYMFYLAFENSRDKDYVTEKMLTAYQNYAVPVVLGDANYESFAPPDSYLNVRTLGPKQVARRMVEMYNNRNDYFKLFQWRNHYTFVDNYRHAGGIACELCAKLNEDQSIYTYENFRHWWNERWWSFCRV